MKSNKEWGVDIGCPSCMNLFTNLENYGKCKAFPEGIPHSILSGTQSHFKRLDEQKNDIVYEERQ